MNIINAAEVRSGEKKFWDGIYKKAIIIPSSKILQFSKKGKIAGIATVHLTKNCNRIKWIQFMKLKGILPQATKEEACYGGSCYKDRTVDVRLNHLAKLDEYKSWSTRNIEFATPDGIKTMLSPKNVKKINMSPFIRLGQSGDDSHAIATGLAEEWLRKSKAAGVKIKSVFISSAYSPTTPEMYAKLSPYQDQFVLHVTQSGYFSREEIENRMCEFRKARDAGINVKIRIITNKSGVSHCVNKESAEEVGPMPTDNDAFLCDLLEKEGVTDILEIPYHNDFTKQKSAPTRKYQAVCGDTGVCKTCAIKCFTK